MKEPTRPYVLSDQEATERCGTASVALNSHLAAFAAELPEFTPAYVADWRAQILAAQEFPTEEYNDDRSILLHNAVNDAVKAASAAEHPIRF
jgi:hypothetical protein